MARKRDEEHKKVLEEARRRFKRCESWETTARKRFIEDLKFGEGDSDNLYQWPEDIRSRLMEDKKAMLTINKANQHVLDVENDVRQAKVAIKVRPTGGGASAESAQVYAGIIRHIEYISNAQTAYLTGLAFALRGGWGYWRVLTGYANDESFDQEIFIRRVKDPLTVYLDPDINEFDGSDARYGFVFNDMPKDEFEIQYPQWKGRISNDQLGPGETWVKEDTVRMAEYFRRVEVSDRLLAYPDDQNPDSKKIVRESDLDPKLAKALVALPTTKVRTIKSHKVEWFKIMGDEVIDTRPWLGSYIPIIRVIGTETVIDGQMDRKGHIRALKDPQRMFNYNASGSVEYGALQSKSPWVAPADAIEGYETYWDTANTENHSVLPFNHRDDDGEEIPAPVRQQPPSSAPVFMQGMTDAAEWMRMVSGQYQADMGAPSNERSGAAITARQRQGDTATFHFLDNQSLGIRLTGKIVMELIPHIYDTTRVLYMLDENGDRSQIKIDPDQQEALKTLAEDRDEVAAIFNPSVGTYEVEADVGPAFQTQRQEAWNAGAQILAQNKDLVHIVGDLIFKNADWPGAEEIAERLKRMVPAQALTDGPPPDLVAAQNQIKALQNVIETVSAKLADKTASHQNDFEKNAITAYDAQTKRLAALKDALETDPDNLVQLVRQVIQEAEATSGASLGPSVTPTPVVTGPAVVGAPSPGGPPPGPATPMAPPQANPADMTVGPAAAPGAAPSSGPPR